MLVMRNFISLTVKDMQKKVKGVEDVACLMSSEVLCLFVNFPLFSFLFNLLEFIALEAKNFWKYSPQNSQKMKKHCHF